MSGVFGFCVVPYIMQIYGRKCVAIGLNVFSAIGFLIFALATNVPCLFVARIVQGFSVCGIFLLAVILGEYSHPKRRGYFLTIKKSFTAIGGLLCHSLALIWNWKQIAAVAVLPYIIAIILTLLCPESPPFLALTGKYVECEKSHTWLFGKNPKSKRELKDLITTQMEYKEQMKRKKNLKSWLRSLMQKDFMKPSIISFFLAIIIETTGKYYMPAYVVQILIAVTKNKSIAAYCSIGSDILTFAALVSSCFVIRCCKRRTLLFTSGATCVILMCLASLTSFLSSRYNIGVSVFMWLTPIVILLNIFIVSMGVLPTCYAIKCEIFPLEHKGTGICAAGVVFTVLYSVVMKCTPIMMEKTGVEGTFGIYAFLTIVVLSILYFILNETKDKSLQEIERDIKGVKQTKFEENYLKEQPLIGPS